MHNAFYRADYHRPVRAASEAPLSGAQLDLFLYGVADIRQPRTFPSTLLFLGCSIHTTCLAWLSLPSDGWARVAGWEGTQELDRHRFGADAGPRLQAVTYLSYHIQVRAEM